MTIKELEIIASSDMLIDMLVYARCQLLDLESAFNISDLKSDYTHLHHTFKSIQDEINRISPHFKQKCIYRKGQSDNINL